jgi:hypothetical protein
VAGWGEDGALEAVTEFAKTIDESPGGSKARCRKRSIARSSPCSLGARRWAAVPQDPGEDAGVSGDDGDYLLRKKPP